MYLLSPRIEPGNRLPWKYSIKGQNINPPLLIEAIPPATHSLVLQFEELVPGGSPVVHWAVYNIAPTEVILEGEQPGIPAINDFERHRYVGFTPADPPRVLRFRISALDSPLPIAGGKTSRYIDRLAQEHSLERAAFTCRTCQPRRMEDSPRSFGASGLATGARTPEADR